MCLNKKKLIVRSIDICEYMGYSKPSVSRAVGILKSNGYIAVDEDGAITLTALGKETAEKNIRAPRHTYKAFYRFGSR